MRSLCVAIALLIALASGPARADADDDRLSFADWLATVHELMDGNKRRGAEAADPLLAPMDLCHRAGCLAHGSITLTGSDVRMLRDTFTPITTAPAEERRAIARAIALYERLVGPLNGTDHDAPANRHPDEDADGQLDCVAEAANTWTYLDRLAQAGLLGHHQGGELVIRFTILLQHVAVEITETATGNRWVVDSWPNAAGDEPIIEPYWEWRLEWQV